MWVRFLLPVESVIGHYYPDEIHWIEDDYIRQNWLDNLFIELMPRDYVHGHEQHEQHEGGRHPKTGRRIN